MKKVLIGLGAIFILAIAYYLISPIFNVVELDESSPVSQTILFQGNFQPSEHEVSGKAVLIEDDNKKILRFENFETINGPDLHIYLSSDLEAKDYVDLGGIKATKGNVNYEVSSDINLEKYNKVLVWCEPFKVLFSYAELKSAATGI